jgi:hypothetical protein
MNSAEEAELRADLLAKGHHRKTYNDGMETAAQYLEKFADENFMEQAAEYGIELRKHAAAIRALKEPTP